MSFQYTTGIAASIADWFTIFEAMVTTAGWSVVQRAGPTDIIISSPGEDGLFTMLFARVFLNGFYIVSELRDDLAGTHETTRGGGVNGAAGAFDYWMNCDADFINICIKSATPVWSYRGFGCVWPMALELDDETYRMVVSSEAWYNFAHATVLRNYLGVWDFDLLCYQSTWSEDFRPHPVDGSIVMVGQRVYYDTLTIGQMPHRTALMWNGVPDGTLITTQDGSRETTWIALRDDRTGERRYAMRTGGDLPIGTPDGSFAYETGFSDTPSELLDTIIPAFMTSLGWTDLGNPGIHTYTHLYYSRGESGTDDIYLIISWLAGAADYLYFYVQDDAVGTHRTTAAYIALDLSNFPTTYHLAGDKDCALLTMGFGGTDSALIWGGKMLAGHPALNCVYSMATYSNFMGSYLLRDCDGNWNQGFTIENDGITSEPGSVALMDDMTCTLWPWWARDNPAAGGRDMAGQLQYLYSVDSTGRPLTAGDEIHIEDKNYKLFYTWQPGDYAIRIA